MGGFPPKDPPGKVEVLSTFLHEIRHALLHGDTKQQWDAAKDIKEKLEHAGY